MKCKYCDQKLTSLTTVIPEEYLDKKPQVSYQRKVRRGMSNWKACYPCDRIIRIDPK